MGLSGYTLHLTNRTAHSGPHGQTGAVYAGGAPGLILLSKTAEVFCWVLQRKKRKYDSFPACLDAAIPFHEQTAFWHRHYSCTAPRAIETPLTDVRTFYLYGRRMREREKQRAFWTSTHALCVDIPRRRGPAGTRSPAAGFCAALASFSVCHRCVEVQKRSARSFHAPCCADSIACTRCRSAALSSAVSCRS